MNFFKNAFIPSMYIKLKIQVNHNFINARSSYFFMYYKI